MSKSGFTRELLREKGFVIVNGVATRVPDPAPGPNSAGKALVASTSANRENRKSFLHNSIIRITRKMTRVETRLFQILTHEASENAQIVPQFRVRVTPWDAPTQVHYTADFAVFEPGGAGWQCRLYEAKDSRRPYHSDELNRPKTACLTNRWIDEIVLAQWDGSVFHYRLLASQGTNPNEQKP